MNTSDYSSMTEEDVRNNPQLDQTTLMNVAQSRPDLRAAVRQHPNCYPGLAEWIDSQSAGGQQPQQNQSQYQYGQQQPQQSQPAQGYAAQGYGAQGNGLRVMGLRIRRSSRGITPAMVSRLSSTVSHSSMGSLNRSSTGSHSMGSHVRALCFRRDGRSGFR